jgi:hypothetical protein
LTTEECASKLLLCSFSSGLGPNKGEALATGWATFKAIISRTHLVTLITITANVASLHELGEHAAQGLHGRRPSRQAQQKALPSSVNIGIQPDSVTIACKIYFAPLIISHTQICLNIFLLLKKVFKCCNKKIRHSFQLGQ